MRLEVDPVVTSIGGHAGPLQRSHLHHRTLAGAFFFHPQRTPRVTVSFDGTALPYMDGNGRLGRFIMNAMLASGGFPWTVLRLEERDRYMAALNAASGQSDIRPVATFVAQSLAAAREAQANTRRNDGASDANIDEDDPQRPRG